MDRGPRGADWRPGHGPARRATIRPRERVSLASVRDFVRRDPFAVATPYAPMVTPQSAVPRAFAPPTAALAVPDIVPSDAPLPERALAVRATITGSRAVAYVANGTAMDIVRVGDIVGDRRVAAIDLHGIAFADGSRLELPDGFARRSDPAQTHAVTLSIEDLRRLMTPLTRTAAPSPSPASTGAAMPYATSAASNSTPAPLTTVDRRGLRPGDNPTPDLVDPTAYPLPYPYAPGATHRP